MGEKVDFSLENYQEMGVQSGQRYLEMEKFCHNFAKKA